MHPSLLPIALYALAASAAPAPAPAPYPLHRRDQNSSANNQALISALELAPTAKDRLALLTPSDFLYDFASPPPGDAITTGLGGRTVKADSKLFPALIGTGVSMTLGFIGPCGFNTPHVHPRSSQINVVVEGQLKTQFIAENGVDAVENTLGKWQMTVFPQGAVHTEWNPTCDPAVFVAGFASEDPGVQQSTQTLFKLDDDVVRAELGVETLNGESIEQFRDQLPENVALFVEECLARCDIEADPAPNQGGPSEGGPWSAPSSALA
ncbi:uncharacterized protein LTR77_004176 [Saxophila tyrrhenica]|uniref:Cupin type-1 domain-containing protein n=1 Tax=Saxophila tyrrhenica TaxID=1690608 RepID=A0AAV9PC23_9PEZI|nr:hypothetical protein LTR77_004176 [Saxophila tyrrhenica]